MCRRDLLNEFGLDAPRTVENTLEVAKTFHNRARNMSGIAWNAARGTPLGHSFLFNMAAFGQPALNLRKTENGFDGENVEGEKYRPMFVTEAAYETAEYLRELMRYSPSNRLRMSWYERARAYTECAVGRAYRATLLAARVELNQYETAHHVTTSLH